MGCASSKTPNDSVEKAAGEPAKKEPLPVQKDPKVDAPAQGVPTERLESLQHQLANFLHPCCGQPLEEESPVTLTPVRERAKLREMKPDPDLGMLLVKRVMQVVKRAHERAALPEHLRLGVTLPGMRELLSQLPSDAVEQVNAKIPLDENTNKPAFPKHLAINGLVQQHFITLEAKGKEGQPGDGLAVCERLKKRGSPHVGEATVFVSWFFETPINTLLDALANFLKQKGLREEDTFFWVCDYVIRQTDVKTDLKWLGDCVSAIGHTVLLMEPWVPAPLKRAYCLKELYHTQKSGAQFDVVLHVMSSAQQAAFDAMSSAQQAAFDAALVDDFASIETSLSKVDVRTAECRNPDDAEAFLDELEQGVGLVESNKLVIGLLREALVAQARAALGRLPAERKTSALLSNMGLLQTMGRLEEMRPLFEETLRARRKTLGGRHPDTLLSITNMGLLLQAMGDLEEARPRLNEAMEGYKETLGYRETLGIESGVLVVAHHKDTLNSINNMGSLLEAMSQLQEAGPLFEEVLQTRRETLGNRHPDTLASVNNMGALLKKMGQLMEARPLLEEARPLLEEALQAQKGTSALLSNLGLLLMDMGQLEEAKPLFEEAMLACRGTLGDRHPQTLLSIGNMGGLLMAMDKLEEAEPLYREVLQACKETLGDRHPNTLASIGNMGQLLGRVGQLEEARPLKEEALQARRETLGDCHPDTLISINNMGVLLQDMGKQLQKMGKLKEARPLLEQALQACRQTRGDRDPDTLNSINNLGMLLRQMGQLEEARALFEEALQAQRKTLGDRNQSTLSSINNLATLLETMGQLEKAKPLHEEVLQEQRKTLGDCHPDTLLSINNLGSLLLAMSQLQEAKPLFEEALQARRETLGDCHPDTLLSINNMGSLLYAMSQLEEARELLEEALQAQKKTLGHRHKDTVISTSNMGKLLYAMNRLEEARPLLEEDLRTKRETLGNRHPDTLISINNMAVLLQAMGQLEEARSLYEEDLQTKRETLGPRHESTLISINNMGVLLDRMASLQATGDAVALHDEALKAWKDTLDDCYPEQIVVLDDAVAISRKTLGADHPITLVTSAKAARLQ